jgi:hypothetical protein
MRWPLQVSVKDLTENNQLYTPPTIKFTPLESKKPLLLFHTKDPNGTHSSQSTLETASSKSPRPVDKEGLETLVIWSEDNDGDTQSCSRHVLPARIAFEHAFWYDLLSQLDGDQSFEWKRKYNCPFLNQQQYDDFTTGKVKKKCPESNCGSYCGGTAMRNFYSSDRIVPNHLSDPSIAGYSISFFRDSKYSSRISQKPVLLNFGGTPGLAPQSCLLKVDGSKRELETEVSNDRQTLTIRVKPGMRIWAQLENALFEDYREEHLNRAWYQDLATIHSKSLLTMAPSRANKNPPRQISIIHAAKKPVVKPNIESLSSKPAEDYKYSHVKEWLTGEYKDLTIEANVVATRLKMHDSDPTELGSSIIAVKLSAKFERLDAFSKDGKVGFVDNESPTGGLELWMRKEEYIDDPDQIVFYSDSQKGALIDHLPNEPVVSFRDLNQNISHRDYRIEFTDDVMYQLKVGPVKVVDRDGDLFRRVTSTVDLRLDAKSKKFEERRYKLRNISMFKGFFTDNPDAKDDAYTRESPEHRVLVLNNTPPDKVEVSHAVTTITEVRERYHHHGTTSHQKGNIVTIYLKRKRLSSGKNERVGVVVYNENSRYHKAFVEGDLISRAGRDIVSDQNKATASPFIRYYRSDTTKQDIIISDGREFDGRFHEDLGIVSYLPQFDRERGLWRFEVELDIKTVDGFQLHNPFVAFSLVHFQPFSVNYNAKWLTRESTLKHIGQDCRLSPVETFIWCYLLPERKLSVSFHKPSIWGLGSWLDRWGKVDLTISFDNESLHYFETDGQSILRSNFILSVEGSNDKIAWHPIMSQVDDGTGKWSLMHPLLTRANINPGSNEAKLKLKYLRASNPAESGIKMTSSQSFSEFRVRLVEVEWFVEAEWGQLKIDDYADIVENQDMRVRYVELVH